MSEMEFCKLQVMDVGEQAHVKPSECILDYNWILCWVVMTPSCSPISALILLKSGGQEDIRKVNCSIK